MGFFILLIIDMKIFKNKENSQIKTNIAQKSVIFLIGVIFFEFLMFPAPVVLAAFDGETVNYAPAETELVNFNGDKLQFLANLPQNNDLKVESEGYFTMTAYNSEPGQTDDTPCITANNFNLCTHGIEDTVATNFLPFGTKVRMPELFGDKIFYVRDRMNKRYSYRFDVWMKEKSDAKQFGVKNVKIEILE